MSPGSIYEAVTIAGIESINSDLFYEILPLVARFAEKEKMISSSDHAVLMLMLNAGGSTSNETTVAAATLLQPHETVNDALPEASLTQPLFKLSCATLAHFLFEKGGVTPRRSLSSSLRWKLLQSFTSCPP